MNKHVYPQPKLGYGFCTNAPGNVDIDLIGNDNWDIVMLGRDDLNGAFVGRTYIDATYCNVWWLEQEDCFIAQVALN